MTIIFIYLWYMEGVIADKGVKCDYDLDLLFEEELLLYTRVIGVMVSLVEYDKYIAGRDISILSILCYMYARGMNLSSNEDILSLMLEKGLGRISVGTLRNYKSTLSTKDWLERCGDDLCVMGPLRAVCRDKEFSMRLDLEVIGE